jgi:hypothetical protein
VEMYKGWQIVCLKLEKDFWVLAQRAHFSNLITRMWLSYLFTASSADIQWPDMHQHMPSHDPNAAENVTSYWTHMKNLNENPAIASYYFQK